MVRIYITERKEGWPSKDDIVLNMNGSAYRITSDCATIHIHNQKSYCIMDGESINKYQLKQMENKHA